MIQAGFAPAISELRQPRRTVGHRWEPIPTSTRIYPGLGLIPYRVWHTRHRRITALCYAASLCYASPVEAHAAGWPPRSTSQSRAQSDWNRMLHQAIIADETTAPLMRVASMDDAPWVSSIIGVDASELMGRVTTLISRHGGFFLEPITSSVLEAHMFFQPEGRGKEALHAARAGLGFAFDMLGAAVVFGRIPIEDRPARLFTRIIGFRSDGIRPREPGGPIAEWFEMRSDECPQQ